MKKALLFFAAIPIVMAFTFAVMQWQVVDGTKTNFNISGMLGSDVNGTVQISKSDINFDASNLPASSFSVVLNVSSLSTNNNKRDEHLKTADFFDEKLYPTITFKSIKVERLPNGKFSVLGDLTIKKKTKAVSIPFTFAQTGETGTFTGSFAINRLDYEVGKKSMAIGDIVKINLVVPVKK